MLAPVTHRDRKSRTGISGFDATFTCRTMNTPKSTNAIARATSVRVDPQEYSSVSTIAYARAANPAVTVTEPHTSSRAAAPGRRTSVR